MNNLQLYTEVKLSLRWRPLTQFWAISSLLSAVRNSLIPTIASTLLLLSKRLDSIY